MANESKAKGTKYRVNWRLDGLSSSVLEAGDIIEAQDKDVAHLVECGVLSPVDVEG